AVVERTSGQRSAVRSVRPLCRVANAHLFDVLLPSVVERFVGRKHYDAPNGASSPRTGSEKGNSNAALHGLNGADERPIPQRHAGELLFRGRSRLGNITAALDRDWRGAHGERRD